MWIKGAVAALTTTYIVVGALGNTRNVSDLGVQILLDFLNEKIYVPFVLERTDTTAHQGEQILTVKVATITHLGPFVTE